MLILHFATQTSFLDPKLTSDGELYGPIRYKEIVRQCYLIAKNCNISYSDVMDITPIERDYLLEFILEDVEKTQEMIQRNREQLYNR